MHVDLAIADRLWFSQYHNHLWYWERMIPESVNIRWATVEWRIIPRWCCNQVPQSSISECRTPPNVARWSRAVPRKASGESLLTHSSGSTSLSVLMWLPLATPFLLYEGIVFCRCPTQKKIKKNRWTCKRLTPSVVLSSVIKYMRNHPHTHTHTHIHAHSTFAGLFYKDYAGDYTGRLYWLFPHSSPSVSLFLWGSCALFAALSSPEIHVPSAPCAYVEMYPSAEHRTSSSPILTFQSRHSLGREK